MQIRNLPTLYMQVNNLPLRYILDNRSLHVVLKYMDSFD